MKIITGGAGFIGSAICWKLNCIGYDDIIIVDTDLKGTKADNLKNLRFREFITKDKFLYLIGSGSELNGSETIYHMGACSSTTEDDMDYLIDNNVNFSMTLAKWAIGNNVKFIYASSAATYGDGNLGFSDEISLLPKLTPLNKYGLSKQMFDMWIIQNKLTDRVVGLKYFNVFGPNENHKGEMRSMVNKAYLQIKNTGKIRLFKSYRKEYADGEQMRDFLYIKDAAEMTVFFDAPNEGCFNKKGIYNIGSGKASTWNELAKSIFKALEIKPNIEYIGMPENIKNQYQYYSKADISKLQSAGYSQEITGLESAIEDYIKHYLIPGKYLAS